MDSNSPNGNGKPLGWRAKTITKSAQLLVADMIGNVAELMFLRFEKPMNKAVPWLRQGFKSLMYLPVKAMQKPVESVLEKASNFEDQTHRDARINQSEEKRLDGLLDAAYDYTMAFGVGFAALFTSERCMSKVMKTGHLPAWSWVMDGIVHTGIIAYLGSDRMKPTTEKIRKTIENGMLVAGWSEENAKRDAGFATIYIVPIISTGRLIR